MAFFWRDYRLGQAQLFVTLALEELAGLTTAPSRVVDVPRVADSLVSFECRSTQIIQLEGTERLHCTRTQDRRYDQ